MLLVRGQLEGADVDVSCWGRFHDRFVKHDGQWRIQKRVPIYEKDRLDPVLPNSQLRLDTDALAQYPHGCRHLVYVQSRSGATIAPDLAVPGNAVVARLEAESAAWLTSEA